MNNGWVISIGAGIWQTKSIKFLTNKGYSVLAIDSDTNAPGFVYSDAKLIIDISLDEEVIKHTINFFSQIDNPIAVICIANEAGILTASRLRELYNLPGTKPSIAKKLINKKYQRLAWKKINSPKFFTQNNYTVNDTFIKTLNTNKVVIKPVDSSGSKGVSICYKFNLTKKLLKKSFDFSKVGEIIIEEYIDGIEYAVESVCISGNVFPIIITQKGKLENSNGTVANILFTYEFSQIEYKKIIKLLDEAHRLLGYTDGVCHTELIKDKKGEFWIIETAGRGAGFGVSEIFIKSVTGYDYLENSINFNLGLKILEPPKLYCPPPFFAIRYIESKPGIFEGITTYSKIPIYTIVEKGQKLYNPTTDGDRIGYFIVNSSNLHELKMDIEKVLKNTKIRVKPL